CAALAGPDITGAKLMPVPAATPAPSSAPLVAPGAVLRGQLAPTLEQAGAEQAEADRTCLCGAVCAARVPVLGSPGESVLLVDAHLLGDVVMVKLGDGSWVAEPVAGWTGLRDNRRRVHRCPSYSGVCVTPGHGGRQAHLYPGGYFCDACIERQGTARRTAAAATARAVKSPGDQRPEPMA